MAARPRNTFVFAGGIGYVLQAIVLVCIVLFVGQFLIQPQDSPAAFDTVLAATTEGEDLSGLSEADNNDIKRYLGLNPSQFEQIAYYKNKDAMQATEFVVVKFADHSQASTFEAAVEARIASQKNIYDGYLPDEASRMTSAVVYTRANYGIYAVGDNNQAMLARFQTCLESGA